MIRALYTAASGMMVEARRLDLSSKNLFHLQTPGFRGARELRTALAATNPGSPSDVQTEYRGEFLDPNPGQLRITGRPLDLALDGEGLFALQTNAGPAYTRDGRFYRAADGTVQDFNGNALLGEKGPIRYPAQSRADAPVEVKEDGTFLVDGKRVDRLLLQDFPGFRGLQQASGSLLFPTGGATPQASQARVLQSTLEDANVNGVAEMTRTIETVRAFEAYQKMIQTVDETTGMAVRQIGRVG